MKGCLSLQAKWGDGDPFVEANLRDRSLDDIWHSAGIFPFNRDFEVGQLTGGCAACRKASVCRGGARCVSSAFNGTVTDDPYCYYRVAAEHRSTHRPPPTTCVAAAALALSMAACDDGTSRRVDAGDLAPRDAIVAVDGSADLDAAGDAAVDVGLDARIPDARLQDGPLADGPLADGPLPDRPLADGPLADGPPVDAAPADAAPDVSAPDLGIDCSDVCCECEYGVIPEEVWAACCAPDPCEDACCECDYGDPPPAECCP